MNLVSSTGSPPGRGERKLVLYYGYRILTVGMANSFMVQDTHGGHGKQHPPVTGAPINLA